MPHNTEGIFKKYCIFTLWFIWPSPTTKNPAPWVMKYTILLNPSLVIITMHLVCLIYVEGFQRNEFSLHHLHGHEPLPRGSWNLQFWLTLPLLSLLYTEFVWTMQKSREDFFLNKYINLTLFTPYLPPLGSRCHEIFNFLSPYPTYQIWLTMAHWFLRRCKRTMNDGRRTTTDSKP